MTNIILWILMLPAFLIDKLNEKNGGIFGGNIRPWLTSAIAEALYLVSITVFLISLIRR